MAKWCTVIHIVGPNGSLCIAEMQLSMTHWLGRPVSTPVLSMLLLIAEGIWWLKWAPDLRLAAHGLHAEADLSGWLGAAGQCTSTGGILVYSILAHVSVPCDIWSWQPGPGWWTVTVPCCCANCNSPPVSGSVPASYYCVATGIGVQT